MNKEIQVGEYVRTKKQGIKKIDKIDENKTVNKYFYFIGYDHNDKEYGVIKTTEILKHSFNLIDLIEVGDYVNGNKVIKKYNDYLMVGTEFINQSIPNELIETIVTKEQFKSMECKVGGEDD